MPKDDFIGTVERWKHEAQELRRQYDDQWTKNIRNTKGVFDAGEVEKSKVRGRSKVFYRKIWAISWRILASFYQIFLREEMKGRHFQEYVLPLFSVHHQLSPF